MWRLVICRDSFKLGKRILGIEYLNTFIKSLKSRLKILLPDIEDIIEEVYIPAAINDEFDANLSGYIFIKYANTYNKEIIESLKFLGIWNTKTTVISEKEINEMKVSNLENKKNDINALKIGDTVKINNGDYQGFDGYIKEFTDNDQIILSVTIFGQDIEIKLNVSEVALSKRNEMSYSFRKHK